MGASKTFVEWCNEYISAINSMRKIASDAEINTNMDIKEYSKLNLLLTANKAIKEESERQIMIYMDNPTDIEDFKIGMLLLEPYMS